MQTESKTQRSGLTQVRKFMDTHHGRSHVIFRERGDADSLNVIMAVHYVLDAAVLLYVSWNKLQSSSGSETCYGVAAITSECKVKSNVVGFQISFWLFRKEKLQKYACLFCQVCSHVTK